MQLDHRLQALADFVRKDLPAADIGTDHGYLAAELIQSGTCPHVIATDKNEGPCLAARRTVRDSGLEGRIEIRMGDGLQPIRPKEVSVICIAGMGGRLITEILAASPTVTSAAEQLVLQPMNGGAGLRHWLYESGWYAEDECLAESDGRIYEIISAAKGFREMPEEILLEIGPCIWQKKPPLLHRYMQERLTRLQRALDGIKQSTQADKNERLSEFSRKVKKMEEYLQW